MKGNKKQNTGKAARDRNYFEKWSGGSDTQFIDDMFLGSAHVYDAPYRYRSGNAYAESEKAGRRQAMLNAELEKKLVQHQFYGDVLKAYKNGDWERLEDLDCTFGEILSWGR